MASDQYGPERPSVAEFLDSQVRPYQEMALQPAKDNLSGVRSGNGMVVRLIHRKGRITLQLGVLEISKYEGWISLRTRWGWKSHFQVVHCFVGWTGRV